MVDIQCCYELVYTTMSSNSGVRDDVGLEDDTVDAGDVQ